MSHIAFATIGSINNAFLHAYLNQNFGSIDAIQQADINTLPALYNVDNHGNPRAPKGSDNTPLTIALLNRWKSEGLQHGVFADADAFINHAGIIIIGSKGDKIPALVETFTNTPSFRHAGVVADGTETLLINAAKGHLFGEIAGRTVPLSPSTHPITGPLVKAGQFFYGSGMNFADEIRKGKPFNFAINAGSVAERALQNLERLHQALDGGEDGQYHIYKGICIDGAHLTSTAKGGGAVVVGELLKDVDDSNIVQPIRRKLSAEIMHLGYALEARKPKSFCAARQNIHAEFYGVRRGDDNLIVGGKQIVLDRELKSISPINSDVNGTLESNRSRNLVSGQAYEYGQPFAETMQAYAELYVTLNTPALVGEERAQKIRDLASIPPEGWDALKYLPAMCRELRLDFEAIAPLMAFSHRRFFPDLYQGTNHQGKMQALLDETAEQYTYLQGVPLSLLYKVILQ